MGKNRRKVWKQKGPFALLTFGEILSAMLTGFILALALLFFQSITLTPTMIFIFLVICFVGIVFAKILMGIANYKIKRLWK